MQLAQVDIKNIFFGTHPAITFDTPTAFISSVLPNIYLVAGVILFLYLVFGGFTIVSSAGNTEGLDKGKKTVTNAIIGFAIIFTSYWIIQIIQVITGIPILNAKI